MFPYDPQLLAAVQSTPRSISEVLGAMQTMEAVLVDGDGLKWFNQLYLQVTQAVAVRVAGGGFQDSGWLVELDVQFAGLYFGALRSWLSGQAAPGCWRALFARRTQTAVARIQFALAGVNAHINHDLPVAIDATCRKRGVTPRHGSPQYLDYTAVNATLDALVETAKRELMVRLLGNPMPAVSHVEDMVAAFSVVAAREAAWTNAEVVWGMPLLAGRFLDMLDGLTAVAGKTLLTSAPLVKAVAG